MALHRTARRVAERLWPFVALGAAALVCSSMRSRQIVVWPPELKTGNLVYPYGQAAR
jgi:hypothetical protein